MKCRGVKAWLALTVLLVLTGGCEKYIAGLAASKMVSFTKVSGQATIGESVSELVAITTIGDLTVVAAEAGHVRIEADVRIKEERAAETAKGTFADHVTVTVTDDTITVANAHRDDPDKDDWAVTLTIHLPANLAVDADTGVGEIDVQGTRADLHLQSGVGDVTVKTAVAGTVAASTGVGDVQIDLETVTGPVTAETGTGDVALAVATAAPIEDVKLTSGVGDVRLKIPPGSAGVFTCETGVGAVTVSNHQGIKVAKSSVSATAEGTIGEGGPRYTMETGVGTIIIE